MSSILGCSAPACNLLTGSSIKQHQHGRPDVEGPLDAASTAGETSLLEYLEGMPDNQVAWGLAGRDQISRLLVFNSIKFKYADRPHFIAKASAGPLAKAIVQALTSGPRLTLLAGHDTNIADLGGLLDAHWRVASFRPTPSAGKRLGFELLSTVVAASSCARSSAPRRWPRSATRTAGAPQPPYRQYLSHTRRP